MCHLFLTSMVSDEKSTVIAFSLDFQYFFLVSKSLIILCLGIKLFEFILFVILSAS